MLLVWPPELELDDEELDEDEELELDEDELLLELFQPEVEPLQPEVELEWWPPARAGAEMARLPMKATAITVLRSIDEPLLSKMVTAMRRKARAIRLGTGHTLVNALCPGVCL